MCGICGIATTNGPTPDDNVRAMCAAMTHRGPDEDGYLFDGGVGLGMRRLKIIDLATGSQPIRNEDGRISVIYNGEIYNYRALRAELEQHGHTFRTESDTETLVHAYEQYGLDFVARLNGMFTLALWDGERLVLARDRAGQKPLFYHRTPDGALTFASEMKALLASGRVPRTVNADVISDYLSTQYIMGPQTIIADVYQLPAGHLAVWEDGEWRTQRYWSPAYTPKHPDSPAALIAQTRTVVREAVERHLMSDVPLGAYLSGGVDSSIVVALMAAASNQRVQTFSIGFDVATYSETDHARRIAERFGTDHHEFIVSQSQVTDVLADVVWAADQPLADTSLMATYLLAKLTRQHVTVALTGDGGDEAFAGYTRYTLDRLLRIYRVLPRPVRLHGMPRIAALLPENPDIPTDRNAVTGLRRLAQASSTSHKASILAWGSFFDETQKAAIYRGDLTTATAERLAAHYDAALAESHLDRTLSADFITYLQDDLLVKADRMAMAHSLETRAPFLDNAVLDFALRLPVRMKLRGTTQKLALRQAFADILPPENTRRVKRGFGMPVASWLRGHMQHYAREVLLDPRTLSRGYWHADGITALLDAHTNGQADHGQRLWALLVLELWHRAYIDSDA